MIWSGQLGLSKGWETWPALWLYRLVKKKELRRWLDGVGFCREGESVVFADMEEDPAVGGEQSSDSKGSLWSRAARRFGEAELQVQEAHVEKERGWR